MKTLLKALCIAIFPLATLGAAGQPDLAPDESSKTISLGLEAAKAETSFVLTNPGSEAVVIKKIQTTCKCLNVSTNTMTIGPGQNTTLSVTVNPEPEAGEFAKAIFVWPEAAKRPLILWIYIKRPTIVNVAPKVADWRIGDNPDAKVIRISTAQPDTRIMQVTSNNPYIAVEVEPDSDGGYSVAVSCPGTRIAFLSSTELTVSCLVNINGTAIAMFQHVTIKVWVHPRT